MFNTKKPAYAHGNFSTTEDYLEEIALRLSGEVGKIVISEDDNGYEDITVDDTEVKGLTVPTGAVAAILSVEADNSTIDKNKVIRFKENGSDPTATSGFALPTTIFPEIIGHENLINFKFIGIESGKTHTIRVQDYKTGQSIQE